MIGLLRRLLGGGGQGPAPQSGGGFDSPLSIDLPTYAVGDIHGRFDLIERLLARLREDAAARGFESPRLVFLGDYVDRGERSAEVLRLVAGLLEGRGDWPGEVHALRGNHEQMMLDFLDAPEGAGPRFLRNGGLQTLASFGVGGVTVGSDHEALIGAAERLEAAAADVTPMLRALPTLARFGNLICAHAGADPDLPPELQAEETLMWGAARFFDRPRADGLWCVHGHYIRDAPSVERGRVAVDTGAYATGALTAARFAEGEIGFLSTAD